MSASRIRTITRWRSWWDCADDGELGARPDWLRVNGMSGTLFGQCLTVNSGQGRGRASSLLGQLSGQHGLVVCALQLDLQANEVDNDGTREVNGDGFRGWLKPPARLFSDMKRWVHCMLCRSSWNGLSPYGSCCGYSDPGVISGLPFTSPFVAQCEEDATVVRGASYV